MTRGKLTLIMICRNEESNVKPCLDSFLPIADEIIINDTGSTDGTISEISKYYEKVRLISSYWGDNFSKSRNMALKMSSNGWIMWADFDDRLPEESIPMIHELKNKPLDSFYYFNIINTHNGSNFNQCRLFPNLENISFEFPVHEQISLSCYRAGLKSQKMPGINILHTGYENRAKEIEKLKRNILIIKTIPGYEENIYWMESLRNSYQALSDS